MNECEYLFPFCSILNQFSRPMSNPEYGHWRLLSSSQHEILVITISPYCNQAPRSHSFYYFLSMNDCWMNVSVFVAVWSQMRSIYNSLSLNRLPSHEKNRRFEETSVSVKSSDVDSESAFHIFCIAIDMGENVRASPYHQFTKPILASWVSIFWCLSVEILTSFF